MLDENLYKFRSYRLFEYTKPVQVNLLLENLSLKEFLDYNVKRYFRNSWYFMYVPQIRIVNTNIRTRQQDYRFINSYKFNVFRGNINRDPNVKQIIFDITRQINTINSRYSFNNKNFDMVFNYITNPNRYSIFYYVISLDNPLASFNESSIYNILRKLYLYKNHLDQFKLPNEMVVHIVGKTRNLFFNLAIDSDWDDIRQKLVYTKSIFSRFASKIDTNIANTNTAKELVLNKYDKEENLTTSDDEIELDIRKTNVLLNIVNPKTNRTDTNAEKLEKAKDIIVSKVVPKSYQNKVDKNKVVDKTISEILEPDVINIKNQLPIDKKNIEKDLISRKFVKTEYENIIPTFNKILDSYSFSDNGFSILHTEILPDKMKSLRIQDSETIILRTAIKFKDGSIRKVDMRIPKLKEDGTLRMYGNDYYISNQLITLPITFPKIDIGRFVSSTTSFSIERMSKILAFNIADEKLPLGFVLTFVFGLDTVCKMFDIKYSISETKSNIKLAENKYISIDNDELSDTQKLLVNSLFPYDIDKYNDIKDEEPLSKEWFYKITEDITGTNFTARYIDEKFKIALDGRTTEILRNKSLPTNMVDIIPYMVEHIMSNYTTSRSDLRELRLRGYESLISICADVLRNEVRNYERQIKYGKTDVVFNISKDTFFKKIITSSAVNLMYKVNPVSEIDQLQKVTYSGYKGLPADTVPINLRGLNLTYYGTIDPVNTPDGGSVGVNQNLTNDTAIISKFGTIIPYEMDKDNPSILSLSTSLAPYISKTEPTRGIFISNHVKQAIPLTHSEPPNVMTGYELAYPQLTSTFSVKSPCNGKIKSVTDDKITINCNDTHKDIDVDIKPIITRSNVGINLQINNKPVVTPGHLINKNDILTDNEFVKNGIMTLGRNFLTSYMFWKGGNFEDGYVVSDAILDKLETNIVNKITMYVGDNDVLNQVNLAKGKSVKPGDIILQVMSTKLASLIDSGLIDSDDLFIEGNKYNYVSSYDGIITDYKVYVNSKYMSTDTINRLKKFNIDYSDEPYIYKNESLKGAFITVNISVKLKLELGDKLSNRGAAKGVTTLIEKEENMPLLPDGRRVEVMINPISVLGRTNVSQIYELYSGEISYQLKQLILNKSDTTVDRIMLELEKADKLGMIAKVCKAVRSGDKQLIKYIKDYSFPIVVPPFNEYNYKDILKFMEILKIPNRYKLKLPEYNKTIDAPVGYVYLYRLHHLPSIKIHARSVASYDPKTGQPLGGKKREGGLRVGELDEWSLMSYNANNTIDELFSFGSDNQLVKRAMYRQIIDTGSTTIKEIKSYQSRTKEYMKYLFMGLMLDIGSEENEDNHEQNK